MHALINTLTLVCTNLMTIQSLFNISFFNKDLIILLAYYTKIQNIL